MTASTRVCTGQGCFSNYIIRNFLKQLIEICAATFEAASIYVHSMKKKVPPIFKEKQHIREPPCTCSAGPIKQHTKTFFPFFIYLPIRILLCKT